jgi:hypothetical protein
MSLLKLWFIRNPVLVSYSICMRQGSSDLSGSQSSLACLCACARAQLGLREFNRMTFRSSNVGSPVTFGREECGNPVINSSGVDAVMFWLIRRANVAPCYELY